MILLKYEQPEGGNPLAALTTQTFREVLMAVAKSTVADYLLSNYEKSDRDIAKELGCSKTIVHHLRKDLESSAAIPTREPNYRKRGVRLQAGERMSPEFNGYVEMPCGRYRRPYTTAGGNRVNLYMQCATCCVCGHRRLVTIRKRTLTKWVCGPKCLVTRNVGRVRITKRDRGPDYRIVYQPAHHRADRQGFVREHVLVAEKMLGRQVDRAEPIHHIDCDGLNNKPSNLHVFSGNDVHKRSHGSLNQCVKSLLESGAIVFNRDTGMYELPPAVG